MNSRFKAGIALTALLVLCLGGWTYWTRTPQYSLLQLSKAVEAKDRMAFEQYVDLDRATSATVEGLAGVLMAEIQKEAAADESGFGALGAALAGGMIEAFKPSAASYLRNAVLDGVETGRADSVFAASRGEGDMSGALDDLGIRKAARARFGGTGDVVRSGDVARVPLKLRYEDLDTTLALMIGMERVGSRWRVVDVDGVGTYLTALGNVERLRLDEVNAGIREEIARHVEIVTPIRTRLRNVQTGWFSSRQELVYEVEIRNVGKQKIRFPYLMVITDGDVWASPGTVAALQPGEVGVIRQEVSLESRPTHRALLRGDPAGYTVQTRSVWIGEEGRGGKLALYPSWHDYLDSLEEDAKS